MNEALIHISEAMNSLKKNLQTAILGQDDLLEKLIITVFSGGHAPLKERLDLEKLARFARLQSLFLLRINVFPLQAIFCRQI